MSTLVYFASGIKYKPAYQNLPYDNVILVDYRFCTGRQSKPARPPAPKGKVRFLGMDCLESIDHFKRTGTKIDCFVCINEGINEGGGRYIINSGFFIGYAMPVLKDEYIHVMCQQYYNTLGWGKRNRNWPDLPHEKQILSIDDPRYVRPTLLTDYVESDEDASVILMRKTSNTQEINIESKIKVTTHWESIWNWYDKLECMAISIKDQGQGSFFNDIPKVVNTTNSNLRDILAKCETHKYATIGFTPWANGDYSEFISLLSGYNADYPKEIHLFHLNAQDFQKLKRYSH